MGYAMGVIVAGMVVAVTVEPVSNWRRSRKLDRDLFGGVRPGTVDEPRSNVRRIR